MSYNEWQESSEVLQSRSRISSKGIVSCIIFITILMSFYDIVFWYTEGGGFMSIITALNAINARSSSIEIDVDGLRLPVIIALGLIAIVAATRFSIEMSSRTAVLFIVFAIGGGGFLFGHIFGNTLVPEFMVAHGYSRCSVGDLVIGEGRGRVYLHDYVLANEACVTRR